VKVTLPGPYLLSRSTWVKNLSDTAYPTREALADDIVQILRDELRALAAAGADIVQFDEPVLTELVFAGKSATRTFMCAALAASASPEGELEFAVGLINRVVAGIDGPILALHVCRGNWSQGGGGVVEGHTIPHPYFARMQVSSSSWSMPRHGPAL
jgi:5-methyltetrahydropteroyltriglutamate--homocysteine methyltransferase